MINLQIGKEYWLDDTKKDSGIFVAKDHRHFYFKPSIGKFYVTIEGNVPNVGLIPFPNTKTNFTLCKK
jgi:hypothetical protein